MNLGDINTKVSELTKADTVVAYPNANRLINMNIWNQKVVTMVLQGQDTSDFDDANHSGYAVLNIDLVADQRDYNFGVSDGVVKVRKVEVSYDAVTANVAYPVDTSEFEGPWMDESYSVVDKNFSQSTPGYGWKFNSLWLFPMPSASTGKVYAEVSRTASDFELSDLTTGTKTPGFDENLHPMIAYGMAYEYFITNGITDRASEMMRVLSDYENRLKKQYGNKNEEYPLRMQSEFIDYS